MTRNYSLLDFMDDQSFLELQKGFLASDNSSENKPDVFTKIKKEDFRIKYFLLTERISTGKTKTYSKSFYEFLNDGVKGLSSNYVQEVYAQFDKKNLFSKEMKSSFVDSEIKKLHTIEKQVLSLDFLPKDIMDSIINEVHNADDLLTTQYIPDIESENKINFNLNRTDIILLFYLLRQDNVIDKNYSDSELGNLLDRYFSYKDDKQYKSVDRSRTVLNKIRNGILTTERSSDRLIKTFFNQDFYKIDLL